MLTGDIGIFAGMKDFRLLAIHQNIIDLPDAYSMGRLAAEVSKLHQKSQHSAKLEKAEEPNRNLLLKKHIRDALYLIGKFNETKKRSGARGATSLAGTKELLKRRLAVARAAAP